MTKSSNGLIVLHLMNKYTHYESLALYVVKPELICVCVQLRNLMIGLKLLFVDIRIQDMIGSTLSCYLDRFEI